MTHAKEVARLCGAQMLVAIRSRRQENLYV